MAPLIEALGDLSLASFFDDLQKVGDIDQELLVPLLTLFQVFRRKLKLL